MTIPEKQITDILYMNPDIPIPDGETVSICEIKTVVGDGVTKLKDLKVRRIAHINFQTIIDAINNSKQEKGE